ncbi:MFS general substrate transporter [Aureobasidium sp. EXF-8845]|nr:MFS general substrate transporter [Aureobasidium sp. EXF-8845]KAI4853592.1 MFS general substrate transporter [Aureobasidium sp. EXF-8846]
MSSTTTTRKSFTAADRHNSAGYAMELEPIRSSLGVPEKRFPAEPSKRLGHAHVDSDDDREQHDQNEILPSPTVASHEALERWNFPKANLWRTFAAFWGFAIMGMNDATYGAIIPYLETHYDLSYTIVSLIFLSPLIGYNASALLNNTIHLRFGQRGVAFIGPICHLVAYVVIAVHPPYPVLVVVFAIAGFGNGLEDAAWNAWMGAMTNANEVLGFLHGIYGLGATIAPLIATSLITKANKPWWTWYYFMIAFAAVEVATSIWAFWGQTGEVFRLAHPRTTDQSGNRMKEALFTMPSARVTWLCALFLLGYVGIEVALGGWITTFMLRERDASAFASGMTATGFWLGITVGRLILGFVTPRIGEKLSIAIYLPIATGLELLFWLVPQFYVSAVAVALQGFFLGPLFPAAVVATTKLLPKHLHVSGIGFAAAFGGSGAAIFPFVTGVVAQAKGVQVLQPIILSLLVVIWLFWISLPRIEKKRD